MGSNESPLLLTYSLELHGGEPLFVSSNCFPVKAENFEPAGHAFHSVALKLLGINDEESSETDDQESNHSDVKGHDYLPSSDSYSTKGKKKLADGSQQKDHYALLGLGHLRFLATEDQIRRSYRDAALKYHPDKQSALILAEETESAKEAKKDEIETHFKAIQEAYEILIDPVKRRIYDSTDEFDDDVPSDCAPQDFFKVFGPAFMRNGRWSVTQPVPSLGDDTTSLDEVDNFYNFWYAYKSWREFPHADEFDLEQAESRDHKRWMERQNTKLREKARKDENARIRTLVDNAYKRDPRILRRKEEDKAEKQRKKEARGLAKKLREEEAARAAEEERKRKEEEERKMAEAAVNQKKLKEKEKKLLRKERTRLRTLSALLISDKLLNLLEDDVEKVCMSFEIEQLRLLCDSMETKVGLERAKLLRNALDGEQSDGSGEAKNTPLDHPQQHSGAKANGTVPGAKVENPLASYEKKEKPWEKEEIDMLRKGMQKYPKGTSRRWEVISEYIGTGRSVEEILKATKSVLLQKPDSAKAFESFLEKRKPAPAIVSPLSTRIESEASPVGGSQHESSEVPKPNQKVEAVPESGGASSGTDDVWSETHERALIQALKTFPKDASQRWERVAAAVPGKTVIQCKRKFALMKENFRSKKNAD